MANPIAHPAPTPLRNFLGVFSGVALPIFLSSVDQTIVAAALPAIAGALGDDAAIAWVMVAYFVALTVAAPAYGRLGDALGHRRMLLAALTVFIGASVVSATATSVAHLLAGRVLQGLGGGGLMTTAVAMIAQRVPVRDRARFQGFFAAVSVTAATLGPVAGGLLTGAFGWRSIFLASIPLGLIAILLVLRLTRPSGAPRTVLAFDLAGFLLFAAFVTTLLLMLELVRRAGTGALPPIVLLGTAAALAALLLLWREMRAKAPLLPLPLLGTPAIWRSDLLAACQGAIVVALLAFVPLLLRLVFGASPALIGVVLLPMTVGIGIGSATTGRLIHRTGRTAVFAAAGLAGAIAVTVALAFAATALPLAGLALAMGLVSVLIGPIMVVAQYTVQIAAPPGMLGAAVASVQYTRSLGAAVGTAVVTSAFFATVAAGGAVPDGLLGTLLVEGPGALDALDAEAREAAAEAIGAGLRNGFLAVAVFMAVALATALTFPVRRLPNETE